MNLLRRMRTSRLLLLCGLVLALGASATAVADSLTSGPIPPPKPLAQAVHDALTAPSVSGVSATIQLTNHLIEASSLSGPAGDGGSASSNPLLSSGSGRLWISDTGRVRLELQSEQGDTEILYDGQTVTVYDASSNSLYRLRLPAGTATAGAQGTAGTDGAGPGAIPDVAQIQHAITELMGQVDVSGALPGDVAGQSAYAVRISPKSDGGLFGAVELAWDADHGVPLELAVYSSTSPTSPVLELKATEVSYGPVAESTFQLSPPAGVKVTEVDAPSPPGGGSEGTGAGGDGDRGSGSPGEGGEDVTGATAVQAGLPFKLDDPDELAGMARAQVRLVRLGGKPGALVTYGSGLGGIAVLESQADDPAQEPAPSPESLAGELPQVAIGSSRATVLPTALGTLLSFQREGVGYVLGGSVTAATAEAAARGL